MDGTKDVPPAREAWYMFATVGDSRTYSAAHRNEPTEAERRAFAQSLGLPETAVRTFRATGRGAWTDVTEEKRRAS